MVKLVSITKGLGELSELTPEEMMAYVARVSNPSNQLNNETAHKLLGYCIKNAHWSVFEQVSMTVEIETSRAIAAQILRHRSFCFQEHSLRYAKASEIVMYPARRQDDKNRQNSIDDLQQEVKDWFQVAQHEVNDLAMEKYNDAIELGIAKEQARFLLPLSTKTRLFMTGSVRSWVHYLQLRSANGTQLEHREIALAIQKLFVEQFPATSKALEWVK